MYARDPAEAVEVLDLLLKFFSDGERWVKGRLSDRRGNAASSARSISSAAITRSNATGPRGIWWTKFPPQGIAVTPAGTARGFEPAFAELCPGDDIGSARLSPAGTVFLISTMGVRTSLSCGRSSFWRAAAMNDAGFRGGVGPGLDIVSDEFVAAACR
jgi:hypothetical protein